MEVEKWSLGMRASNCVKKSSKISAFKGRLGQIENDLHYWVKEIQLLLIPTFVVLVGSIFIIACALMYPG